MAFLFVMVGISTLKVLYFPKKSNKKVFALHCVGKIIYQLSWKRQCVRWGHCMELVMRPAKFLPKDVRRAAAKKLPTLICSLDKRRMHAIFCSFFAANVTGTCGGIIRGQLSGNISSPGFPDAQYPNGVDCIYDIEVKPGSVVAVRLKRHV